MLITIDELVKGERAIVKKFKAKNKERQRIQIWGPCLLAVAHKYGNMKQKLTPASTCHFYHH